MADVWKLVRHLSPRQLSLSCVTLAMTLAIGISHLLWFWHTGAIPDGLTVVAGGAAVVVSAPMVQMFVQAVHDLRSTNEQLIAMQAQLTLNNTELATTRDALATLNDELEGRVARRTVQLEKALTVAEKANDAKSAFLANMSHELRTPLNAIIGYAEMIAKRDALFGTVAPERIDEYAGAILSSGRHLNAMVNDLLDLSRVEFGQYAMTLEPVCARRLVRDAVDELSPAATARSQSVEVVLPACLPSIRADIRAMRQILSNLISNALKYSQDGDTITVTLDTLPGTIRFAVSDTGIGMSDEAIAKATQPFSKFSEAHIAAGQSIGLGLSIVKRLCDLLGASFSMTSTEGLGTTVSIDMPIRIDTPQYERPLALAG